MENLKDMGVRSTEMAANMKATFRLATNLAMIRLRASKRSWRSTQGMGN